jgi:hypothetical protein
MGDMFDKFQFIISRLIKEKPSQYGFFLIDTSKSFQQDQITDNSSLKKLLDAFMIKLSGEHSRQHKKAEKILYSYTNHHQWSTVATFLINGLNHIEQEITSVINNNADFQRKLNSLFDWINTQGFLSEGYLLAEKLWPVFFPEGTGIIANKEERIKELRKRRTIRIRELNRNPIKNAAQEILYTGNILLTLPSKKQSIDKLPLSSGLRNKIKKTLNDKQLYWYDHPIQIGVETDKNEAIYGLWGLQEALEFERNKGNVSYDEKLTCLLSVSVTHPLLHNIAKEYLLQEFLKTDILKDIDIYLLTENDTQRIINEILVPAAKHYLKNNLTKELLQIVGVDGEYGRHYNFLKAISAFWQVMMNPGIKATFKIDLDQVFPQQKLLKESGQTAFEHLTTPLWGAIGESCWNEPVELGMLAGALVNQKDIHKSLYTPDIPFPSRTLSEDEYIFFSPLPQALSTAAEMMVKYNTNILDGRKKCIQRFHVTGGTTGILIESIFHFRPFTLSFIGRAEDQAYIFPALTDQNLKLGYIHKDGLIMRHDKEGFAQEAIQSANISKIIGDYIRTLNFSKYGTLIQKEYPNLKPHIDPFTGCFVSLIPITVVYLRLVLKAASLITSGEKLQAKKLVENGAKRIPQIIAYLKNFEKIYKKEKKGWDLYYDILQILKIKIKEGDHKAQDIQKRSLEIISDCKIE